MITKSIDLVSESLSLSLPLLLLCPPPPLLLSSSLLQRLRLSDLSDSEMFTREESRAFVKASAAILQAACGGEVRECVFLC